MGKLRATPSKAIDNAKRYTPRRLTVSDIHHSRMPNVRDIACSDRTSYVAVARSTRGHGNFTLKTILTTRCATARRNLLAVNSLFRFWLLGRRGA